MGSVDNREIQSSRDLVGSLERGLCVMEVLVENPTGRTLTEVADEAGLTRAGARRFLLTLVAAGYATQQGRRFVLSPKLLTLGRDWLGGTSLWTFADAPMRVLAEQLNESCSAAVLSGENIVYVARIPGERITKVDLSVGGRLPAYCTSTGRVLLADLSPAEIQSVLARSTIRANTLKTLTDKEAIVDAVLRAGQDGYAVIDEELEVGLRSIAVPIRGTSGRVVAAVNISTQSQRYRPSEMVTRILPKLRHTAAEIESFVLD